MLRQQPCLRGPASAEATELNLKSQRHKMKSVRNAATQGLQVGDLGQRPVEGGGMGQGHQPGSLSACSPSLWTTGLLCWQRGQQAFQG